MTDNSNSNPSLGFIRLSNAALFSNSLRSRGIDPEAAFKSHGLSATAAADENLFVHAEVFYGLTNTFADLVNDKFLGVRVGEGFAFSDWPPFASAASNAKTLSEFLIRYVQMVPTEVSSVKHSLLVEPNTATYQVTRFGDPGVAPVQVTGFGCAQYIRVIRAVTGQFWDPTKVTFKSKYIGGIPADYQDVQIAFSSNPGIEITFPVDWLFKALQLNIQVAEGQTSKVASEVTVVTALRSVLAGNLDKADLGPVAVAKLLGLEGDRLVKALKQNGTTLSKEVKRLKIERAKSELSKSDKTISEIGLSLGYHDNAHFTRFFRSQTGVNPSAFRSHAASARQR
ncbi:hypothetical protein RA28_06160 [Ruegeria sp. ANG-S4]|uniref:AraC family transcriptional regulator n=1 Tax=Ruegeria sp. ANG-S4 TaxID=1577904 RepID=UPI00057E4A9C|nr:AraC family transcriptional regulator [Ruegeria sp. ANG-S4]KIC47243.1 hypothetical protein RA28_06160 [Ruegeria sp. ANG-S4]